MTLPPNVLAILIKELGMNDPHVKNLVEKQRAALPDDLQARMGIHPQLTALRKASKEYELGQAAIWDRTKALRACEEKELSSEDCLKAIEQGRRDARVARMVRNASS